MQTVYTLENEFLAVKVQEQGAELISIVNKKTNLEYLWQAGEAWPKHAPVLFPIVGQLKENAYLYKGQRYQMDRHGFARNKLFKTDLHEPEKITMSISDDEKTRSIYPFHFGLSIHYEIAENTLTVIYEVKNNGDDPMWFSIGGHPAFKIPLLRHEKYDDYFLSFEKRETVQQQLLTNGLFDGRQIEILRNDDSLPLSKKLFYDDALVLSGLKSELITIRSSRSGHGLHFLFKGFPYFGIWAARDADFICLEPWHGIADHVNHEQQLENKKGIRSLEPGKNFRCVYAMVPF